MARPIPNNQIERMYDILTSGELRRDTAGTEYDAQLTGRTPPGIYTSQQQERFSTLAQSLTYTDAAQYYGADYIQLRGEPGNYSWYGRSNPGGMPEGFNESGAAGTDTLSNVDLYKLLGDMPSRLPKLRGGNKVETWMDPRSAPGYSQNSIYSSWGNLHAMARDGANVSSGSAFESGSAGSPNYVDPFEGVDTSYIDSPPKTTKYESTPPPPPSHTSGSMATGLPPSISKLAPLPGQPSKIAGSGRRRSRSADMTEQPTAGRLLGAYKGSQVLG